MDKLERIFHRCRQEKRAALIIFAVCGYPTLEASERFIEEALRNGADIIELGVPFSDPMADGIVIRHAAETALKNRVNLSQVLDMAERLGKKYPEKGFILFSYMNPMCSFGYGPLCARLEQAAADGILAVDLPFGEQEELLPFTRRHHLHLISLVAPTTTSERARRIMTQSSGFVYHVNVNGVTGERSSLGDTARLEEIRSYSNLPVAAGFGVGSPEIARSYALCADAVIVGSAFVSRCGAADDSPGAFVRSLAEAVRFES